MATTLQKPPHPSQMDPRMRRAVYAKYREMLVSKHNQANEIIKQLPAFMVREDRGFNTMNAIANDAPPPPPIPSGHLPAQRLQTQMAEAPACVQNAMMTKDKKPFTYTPGGIDLSQIKSPRMAKRISANANSPGVGNSKISPLAQINNGSQSPAIQTPQTPHSAGGAPPPPPPPAMGSLAMGMPFQVFPTGPPPPPPPMKQQQSQGQLSAPQTNGSSARKSPQHFEPPPMGCRPEIKIPENPMAILKKVPKPQPKDDFWIQEYVQDKGRNSISNEEEFRQQISSPVFKQAQQESTLPSPVSPPPLQSTPPLQSKPVSLSRAPVGSQQQQPQQQQQKRRSPSPPTPPQLERSEVNIPIQNIKLDDFSSVSPTRVQVNQSPTQHFSQPPTPAATKNVTIEPLSATNFNKSAQSYQPLPQSSGNGGRIILSTMPNRQQQSQQHLGSLYIPPPPNVDDKQYLLNQQSPPWMSTKQPLDTPEWVNRDEVDNFIQQVRSTQATGPKEHVIPISVEKSPAKPASVPGIGPQPFYTPQHHINSVISPKIDPNANKFVNQGYNNIEFPQAPQAPMRPYVQAQRQQQQPQHTAGTRIIPIQVEGASQNENSNSIVIESDPRSPQSPRVMAGFGPPMQSRSFKILQQVTGTMGDDSDDSNESKPKNMHKNDDDEPMQEQKAIFSRALGPSDMTESQLKRLQLSENDRALMNHIKSQVDSEVYLHTESDPRYKGSAIPSKAFKCLQAMLDYAPNNVQAGPAALYNSINSNENSNEQQSREPGLYQGSAIPSRSFKMLQQMTQPENAANNLNECSDIEGNSYAHIGSNLTNDYCYQNCQNDFPNCNHYNHCTVPQMIPPFMLPPQYAAYYDWYDPQNNPWAACYYHPGYDSNYFGYVPSHSRSQTPQPHSQSQQQTQQPANVPPMPPYLYPAYPPFVFLPPFVGFRPISASRETTPCFSEAERHPSLSSASDDRNRRAVSCTPTCCQHAKSFQVENVNNKFHTFEEPLVRSVSVQSDTINENSSVDHSQEPASAEPAQSFFPIPSDQQIRKSLRSIPSVTNVNVLNDDCELEELKAKPIVTNCDDEDDATSETSEDTTEVEEEISQDTETVEVHYPHQLSIIYEENESAANERRSSICSRSSTLSDCSTTLMEDDNLSVDNSGDELEDENSNSVTVRLPLKFSFTRSEGNMVNTTLTVGETEREVIESNGSLENSPSMPTISSNQTHSHSLSNNSSTNDISVTFSLKSKSKSKTPERFITPTLSAVECDSIDENDDERECSVSISLPRRKSKSSEGEENVSIRKNSDGLQVPDDDTSENSVENKSRIDNSLYTSIDALEEIKKGMAEINNSLFNRICTLRKSAINIPEHERENRSGSVSYIDSIESDSEELGGDEILDFGNDNKELQMFDKHQQENDEGEIFAEENHTNMDESRNSNQEEAKQREEKTEEDGEIDFWSQISPDKNADEDYNLSKTSTRSSRYWFEDETEDEKTEPPKDDGFAKYETNDVTTSVSFVSINDAETVNDDNEEDVDFWKGYDSDKDECKSKAKKFFDSRMNQEGSLVDESEVSVYDDAPENSTLDTAERRNSQKSLPTSHCENKDSDNKSEYDDDSDTESCKAYEYENSDLGEEKGNTLAVPSSEVMDVRNELAEIENLREELLELEELMNAHHSFENEEDLEFVKEDEEVSMKATQIENENLTSKPSVIPSEIQNNDSEYSEEEEEEEWTEEEIEESEEEAVVDVHKHATDQNKLNTAPLKEPVEYCDINKNTPDANAEESEYEETEDEESDLDDDDNNTNGNENADVEAEKEIKIDNLESLSVSQSSSNNKIAKGKSLVNVSSFIHTKTCNGVKEALEKVENLSESSVSESEEDEDDDDDDDDEEEEEEDINYDDKLKGRQQQKAEEQATMPCKSSNNINNLHSNDDCHDLITPYVIPNHSHDDKVLLSSLTQIHSVDSKSNMTSESGISFEQHDADSEDGYEEDSDEDVTNENDNGSKTIETKIPQQTFDFEQQDESQSNEKEKEIKVNVKGKISMFERAMSEEKTCSAGAEKTKDVPKVSAKYSFRRRNDRESSEPPASQKCDSTFKRAASEIKETPKNQKTLNVVTQRKSQPVVTLPTIDSLFQIKTMKEKISSFETVAKAKTESDANEKRENYRRYGNSKINTGSTSGRSIDESGEEDSGVTSDFCKQLSENETDSENFPELRKMSRYERASTHSRLYKLLQGDDEEVTVQAEKEEQSQECNAPPAKIPYKSKKIIHNVSVTRRQNPQAALQAESMEERRQRLCLPLTHQSSSGAESMSSSTTPSPTPAVNEKLVQELVQSLLNQKRGRAFRDLPIEKLHAAAVKILQEDMESLSSTDESAIPTVDSTPALTPQEFRNNSSYAEYYDSWQSGSLPSGEDMSDVVLIQSKAFKNLQEQQALANKKLWSVRCPRILSSKSINKDLARLSEVRESESPEPNHSRSPSLRSMSTEPISGESKSHHIHHHHHHQERLKAANT